MCEINDTYQQGRSLQTINYCKNPTVDKSYTEDNSQYILKFGIDRLLGQQMTDQTGLVEHKICAPAFNFDGHHCNPDPTERLHSENNHLNSLETVSKSNIPTRSNLVKPFPRRVECGLFAAQSSTGNTRITDSVEASLSNMTNGLKESFPIHSKQSKINKTGEHATSIRGKRSWSRAVFSSLQRKGLERTFQDQKYITKPDRKRLAANLGLHDSQFPWIQSNIDDTFFTL
ncbi:homeobox protein BarH-like 2 isoform X2 [Anopheles albimanus]|uniref:homeobox protein BarH-like 2 isoform X2 n=1 Tax=Anopheles albimanus TaxID=7167 RepID=UPI0016405CC4|nr:homeobox protein BarH-like 2 isoform X2 [Anopheles albimanus]